MQQHLKHHEQDSECTTRAQTTQIKVTDAFVGKAFTEKLKRL